MILKPEEIVPNKQSSASEWILWHQAMKQNGFGRPQANSLWLKAWNKRGCTNGGLVYWQTAGLAGGCDANTVELREYAESQGMKVEGGMFSFIPDTLDDVEDFASQAFNVSKHVFIAIVLMVIAFIGMILYSVARNPQMVVSAGKAYANTGLARAIAGSARTGGAV